MKKLSICITRYKEEWSICKDLFDSIVLQRGIDFDDLDVIVVNDGKDDLLDEKVFEKYPFKVRYVAKEHSGVSATRNYALDLAEGEYVIFCDIDDMFLNNCGLHLLFSEMKNEPEFLVSSFIEELYMNDGAYKIVRHDKDITFIHGKMYKRQFLIDNNLRFNEDLTIHEDGYFNVIVSVCAETPREIKTPFYIWKWNPNSVVRENPDAYIIKTYDHLMKSREAICEELEKRGFIDKYFDSVVKTVVDSYYDFNNKEYLRLADEEMIKNAEKAFKKFYTKFSKDYNECNINRIAEMMFVCRERAYTKGLRVEQTTISEFLRHIERDVK